MTTGHGAHERVYGWMLRIYPAAFRARHSAEMVQLFGDQLRDARSSGAPAGVAGVWLRAVPDLVRTAASEHLRRGRRVAHSMGDAPSTSSRLLGLAGILGGIVLLAAFVIDIAPGFNLVRGALFNVGAMAIVIGVYRRHASPASGLVRLGAISALLANGWYLAMIVLSIDRPQLPQADPEFRLVGFYAAVAMWLADAAFGLVTLRSGAITHWGAGALAIGSVLAITGIDRLGLTSTAHPTIFGPLALGGIVLNGIAWIVLGLDVAFRRRASDVLPQEPRSAI
jgi:hypothetical protein